MTNGDRIRHYDDEVLTVFLFNGLPNYIMDVDEAYYEGHQPMTEAEVLEWLQQEEK